MTISEETIVDAVIPALGRVTPVFAGLCGGKARGE
jgi:hypothetical protein